MSNFRLFNANPNSRRNVNVQVDEGPAPTLEQVTAAYNAGHAGNGHATRYGTFRALGGVTGTAGRDMEKAVGDNIDALPAADQAAANRVIHGLFAYHVEKLQDSKRADLSNLGNAIANNDTYLRDLPRNLPGLDPKVLNLTHAYRVVEAASNIKGGFTEIEALRKKVVDQYAEKQGRTEIFMQSLMALEKSGWESQPALVAGFKVVHPPKEEKKEEKDQGDKGDKKYNTGTVEGRAQKLFDDMKARLGDDTEFKPKTIPQKVEDYSAELSKKETKFIEQHKYNSAKGTDQQTGQQITGHHTRESKTPIYTTHAVDKSGNGEIIAIYSQDLEQGKNQINMAFYLQKIEYENGEQKEVSVVTLAGDSKEKAMQTFIENNKNLDLTYSEVRGELHAILKDREADINKFADRDTGVTTVDRFIKGSGVDRAAAAEKSKEEEKKDPGTGASTPTPGKSPSAPVAKDSSAVPLVPATQQSFDFFNEYMNQYYNGYVAEKATKTIDQFMNVTVSQAPTLIPHITAENAGNHKLPDAKDAQRESLASKIYNKVYKSGRPNSTAEERQLAVEQLRFIAAQNDVKLGRHAQAYINTVVSKNGEAAKGSPKEYTKVDFDSPSVRVFMKQLATHELPPTHPWADRGFKTYADALNGWKDQHREGYLRNAILFAASSDSDLTPEESKTLIESVKQYYNARIIANSAGTATELEGMAAYLGLDKKYHGIALPDAENAKFADIYSNEIGYSDLGYLNAQEKAGLAKDFQGVVAKDMLKNAGMPNPEVATDLLADYYGLDQDSPNDQARVDYLAHVASGGAGNSAKALLAKIKPGLEPEEIIGALNAQVFQDKVTDFKADDLAPTFGITGYTIPDDAAGRSILNKLDSLSRDGLLTQDEIVSVFDQHATKDSTAKAEPSKGEEKEAVASTGAPAPTPDPAADPAAPSTPATSADPKVAGKGEEDKKGKPKPEERFADAAQTQMLIKLADQLNDGRVEGERGQVQKGIGIDIGEGNYVSTDASRQYDLKLLEFLKTGDQKVSITEAQELASIIQGGYLAMSSKDVEGDITAEQAQEALAQLNQIDPSKALAANTVQNGVPDPDKVEKT